MGRIKKLFIDKIIKDKKITFSKNKNFYLYVYVNIKNGVGRFNINNNFLRQVTKKLTEYINNSKYKNVVLICRSEKEQFTEAFPSLNELLYLKDNTKKNLKIFYQDP